MHTRMWEIEGSIHGEWVPSARTGRGGGFCLWASFTPGWAAGCPPSPHHRVCSGCRCWRLISAAPLLTGELHAVQGLPSPPETASLESRRLPSRPWAVLISHKCPGLGSAVPDRLPPQLLSHSLPQLNLEMKKARSRGLNSFLHSPILNCPRKWGPHTTESCWAPCVVPLAAMPAGGSAYDCRIAGGRKTRIFGIVLGHVPRVYLPTGGVGGHHVFKNDKVWITQFQ